MSAQLKLRETEGNFTSTDIQREAGIPENQLSARTLRRYLKEMGYGYKQCRRKGILLQEHLDRRLKFAKKCKRLPPRFWKEGISFYLDGVSFVYKVNPSQHVRTLRTRTWIKKGEVLSRNCTAKGKKEGANGRVAKFICAIAYGRGFIKCHHYTGSIDGEKCKIFIEEHFPSMLKISPNPKGKLFLQDGDPSQNSALASETMDTVGCRLFKIHPTSPDLNPIANVLHNIRPKISKETIQKNIKKKHLDSFVIV